MQAVLSGTAVLAPAIRGAGCVAAHGAVTSTALAVHRIRLDRIDVS